MYNIFTTQREIHKNAYFPQKLVFVFVFVLAAIYIYIYMYILKKVALSSYHFDSIGRANKHLPTHENLSEPLGFSGEHLTSTNVGQSA